MIEKATVYSCSVIHSASENFKDRTPYVIALLAAGDDKFVALIEKGDSVEAPAIGTEVTYLKSDDSGTPVYTF